MMAQGVGVGFEGEMDEVNQGIERSLQTSFDVESPTLIAENSNNAIIELLTRIANKTQIIDIDGREVARALNPYQDEVNIYNARSPQLAY